MAWRGVAYEGPAPPEPWPGRYEAFMAACATYAGQRERDLLEVVAALAGGSEDESGPKPKERHPMRGSNG